MVAAAKARRTERPAVEVPWVEKYRPRTLEQVAAQEHAVQVLKKALLSANLPHMLFYGPPGTGKTSTILALAKELFGSELAKSRVLELNASDERGISIIREKVKNFAKTTVAGQNAGFPCPPYKIIILDEADSMTQDAQSALRRTMENYSKTTRFCLICNYVTRIIEPLASRCSKFRFKALDDANARRRLEWIANKEGVQYEEGVLETLLTAAEGDLRKAITHLQSAARLHRITGRNGKPDDSMDVDPDRVSNQTIVEIAGVVPSSVVEQLYAACQPAQGAVNTQRISDQVGEIVCEGYATEQVLSQLHDHVLAQELLDPRHKAAILMRLSEIDKRLTDGADEYIQLLDAAMSLARTISNGL